MSDPTQNGASVQDPIQLRRIDEWVLPVTLNTAVHIGTGVENEVTDAPVLTTADDRPLVPGSSLKGVFRSISERLAHVLNLEIESCRLDDGGCTQTHKVEIRKLMEKNISDKERFHELLDSGWVCPTCQLYGSGVMASKIFFSDLVLDNARTHIRQGVVIDRDTGAAAAGLKYDYEIAYASTPPAIHVRMENATPTDHLLFGLALQYLYQGSMRLGGGTSRGLGEVRPYRAWGDQSGFRWRETDLSTSDAALRYFLKDQMTVDHTWDEWNEKMIQLVKEGNGK